MLAPSDVVPLLQPHVLDCTLVPGNKYCTYCSASNNSRKTCLASGRPCVAYFEVSGLLLLQTDPSQWTAS